MMTQNRPTSQIVAHYPECRCGSTIDKGTAEYALRFLKYAQRPLWRVCFAEVDTFIVYDHDNSVIGTVSFEHRAWFIESFDVFVDGYQGRGWADRLVLDFAHVAIGGDFS